MHLKVRFMQYLRNGKRLGDKVLTQLDNLTNSPKLASLREGEFYGFDGQIIPVDQLGNPDPSLVESHYGPINDKQAAEQFGTNNLSEYSYWSWRACGVANVATILKSTGRYSGNLYDLVKEIDNADGYLKSNRWGDSDIGWKHDALKNALVERGIPTTLAKRLSISGLLNAIRENAFVIASIRSRVSAEGSHMVTVFGMKWRNENSELFLYDPYNLDGRGGLKTVSFEEFSSYFLNRGIIAWPQQSLVES